MASSVLAELTFNVDERDLKRRRTHTGDATHALEGTRICCTCFARPTTGVAWGDACNCH